MAAVGDLLVALSLPAAIVTIVLVMFVLRAEKRLRHRLQQGHVKAMAIRQEAIAGILAPPVKDVVIPPPPRTLSEHRSRARWGMGGLAAVPVAAWARDHHVPTMLAVAAVGGVLTLTPSLAPYISELPPQAERPTVTAPPLDPRPEPPTEPGIVREEPSTAQEPVTGVPPAQVTESVQGIEEPTATPPPITTEPDSDDGRQQPPAQPPPSGEPPPPPPPEPDCAEVLPAPEVDVDGCLTEVGQVIDNVNYRAP